MDVEGEGNGYQGNVEGGVVEEVYFELMRFIIYEEVVDLVKLKYKVYMMVFLLRVLLEEFRVLVNVGV